MESNNIQSLPTFTENQKLADYAMAYDLIGKIAKVTTEDQVIEKIFELFTILSSAGSIAYLQIINNEPGSVYFYPSAPPNCETIKKRLIHDLEGNAWITHDSGFILRISLEDASLGLLEVKDIPFMQYRDYYLNLGINLISVIALAISNARSYQYLAAAKGRIQESEERVRLKLESILSPEGNIGNLELADIIDVPAVQSLVDNVYKFVHLPVGIVDLKGKVLIGVGWQDVCTKFHRVHPETFRHCMQSDLELTRSVSEGEFKLYKCKNGMWDSVTPIVVGGRHMGNLFWGQFFFEDEQLDREFFRSQARKYGFNEEEYLGVLEKVPRVSRKTLDAGMAFYLKLTDMLSKLSYSNLKLARSLNERDAVMESLQQTLSRLELLAQTAGELLQATQPQKAVESVCRKVMEYLDCQAFFNFLVDEEAGKLHLNACSGIPEEEVKKIEWLDFGVAICGCAARDGSRIIAENIPTTSDERTELVKSYGIKAYCCHPLLGPGGKVIGTLSFGTRSRDTFREEMLSLMKAVTDLVATAMVRMKSEADILKLSEDVTTRNVELEQANKELEAFSYSVSHDLRAPLRHMSGFVQMLQRKIGDSPDEQIHHYTAAIARASKKMGTLIDDLLSFSRIGRSEMKIKKISLNTIVREAVEEIQSDVKGRDISWKIDKLPDVYGDRPLLKLVFVNLISNAVKYTSTRPQTEIVIGCKDEANQFVFFVKDNGVGFDMAYVDKLFGVFQRLHGQNEFEGTGIGLANVGRIVSRHGGRTWAEGAEGEGATFYFTLPKTKEI